MEQVDFATVSGSASGVGIACTDSAELEWLVAAIRQIFPKLDARHAGSFPTADRVREPKSGYLLKKLDSRDSEVAWLVVRELCHRGWEPLGAASYVAGETTTNSGGSTGQA